MLEMTWIDKSEKRPEMINVGDHFRSKKQVLFVSKDNEIHKGFVRMWSKGSDSRLGKKYEKDSYFWYYHGNREIMADGGVTIWMPLPELPKK